MSSLLNRQAMKQHIKNRFEVKRPHLEVTRVSEVALNQIEAFLKVKIDEAIHSYPSGPKTFLHFF